MRWVDLFHRWAGGVVGLLLALLGLSGAILVFKHRWLAWLPGASDPQRQEIEALARQMEAGVTPASQTRSVVFAQEDFGLTQLSYIDGSGAYADQSGEIVTAWTSQWDRIELWLFDFHHHLFLDDLGETAAGIAALIGLVFVVTGAILWWRLRGTFRLRLWPKRMSRSAIVTQHRDIGIVFAPMLFLTMATGMLMVFKPVSNALFMPGQAADALQAPFLPPEVQGGGALAPRPDWRAMFTTARALYPDAEIRLVALPREPGKLIQMRLRQPAEWLPNGRTLLWFRPDNGALVDHRDVQKMAVGIRAYHMVYPIHAAKVGGIIWQLLVAATGLVLALLGSLAVWSFWFKRRKPARGA